MLCQLTAIIRAIRARESQKKIDEVRACARIPNFPRREKQAFIMYERGMREFFTFRWSRGEKPRGNNKILK